MNDLLSLRTELRRLSDGDYKAFNDRIVAKPDIVSYGVRMGELRRIAREILRSPEWYLELFPTSSHEEHVILALVIAGLRLPMAEKRPLVDRFVATIDNWAVCDSFVAALKLEADIEGLEWLRGYVLGTGEYGIRFGIVSLMTYYYAEEYRHRAIELILSAPRLGYYVDMAIAWALSVAYVVDRPLTEKYLTDSRVDGRLYALTRRKILDSYRVSDSDKAKIR